MEITCLLQVGRLESIDHVSLCLLEGRRVGQVALSFSLWAQLWVLRLPRRKVD